MSEGQPAGLLAVQGLLAAAVDAPGSSLRWMPRIDASASATPISWQAFRTHVALQPGLPLVLTSLHKCPGERGQPAWEREGFGFRWLRGNCGEVPLEEPPRDFATDEPLPGWRLEDFLAYMDFRAGPAGTASLAAASAGAGGGGGRMTAAEAAAGGRTLYVHNVQCPLEWRDRLEERLRQLPVSPRHGCSVLNDLPEDVLPYVPEPLRINIDLPRTGLPPSLDLCIKCSLLVYGDAAESYTVWVCTASHDAAAALVHDQLFTLAPGDPAFVARIAKLASAPFPIYITMQREGDLVVLPPDSVYCCTNGGGRCIHVAWDMHTPDTLEHAYDTTMPRLRAIGKAEVHLIKAMAFYSLSRRSEPQRGKVKTEDDVALVELPPLLRVVDSVLQDETLGDDEGPWQSASFFPFPVHAFF